MVISVDAEKTFDTIQQLYVIKRKNFTESGHRRYISQYKKAHI